MSADSGLASGTSFGPYATEREALAAPMPRAVARLHDERRVRPGDPDHLVRSAQLDALRAACVAAGVTLGAFDESVLTWFASWEPSSTQVVVGIIHRAVSAGANAQRHACDRCGFTASTADVSLFWGVGVQAECRDTAACEKRTRRAERLRAAVAAVEWARNSGDGSVDFSAIDELTEAAGAVV